MKKSLTLNIKLLFLILLTLALYTTILMSTNSASDVDCCEPLPFPSPVPRFAKSSTVNIYVDAAAQGGFTETERQKIEQGLEDWNGRNNSSGLIFNVDLTATPPPPGTANTILVHFNPTESRTAVATLTPHRNSGNVIWMEMTFNGNIRTGNAALAPEFVREIARHEGGHAHGLDEGDNSTRQYDHETRTFFRRRRPDYEM